MANRKSYTGFPTRHHPRFYTAPDFRKMGINDIHLSSFIQVSTMKEDKSAAKFHYIKTVSGIVVAQSIAFRVVSIYWQGRSLSPEILTQSDLPPPDSSESWHVLPCSASTVRASKKVQLWRIGSRILAFQRAINQGSTPPLTFSKWGSNT